jgi:hypothetical protein
VLPLQGTKNPLVENGVATALRPSWDCPDLRSDREIP